MKSKLWRVCCEPRWWRAGLCVAKRTWSMLRAWTEASSKLDVTWAAGFIGVALSTSSAALGWLCWRGQSRACLKNELRGVARDWRNWRSWLVFGHRWAGWCLHAEMRWHPDDGLKWERLRIQDVACGLTLSTIRPTGSGKATTWASASRRRARGSASVLASAGNAIVCRLEG